MEFRRTLDALLVAFALISLSQGKLEKIQHDRWLYEDYNNLAKHCELVVDIFFSVSKRKYCLMSGGILCGRLPNVVIYVVVIHFRPLNSHYR